MHQQSRDPETPTPASEEAKPESSTGNGNGTSADTDKPKIIAIKVADQAGTEITFKIKRTKPLGKIMEAYCKAKEIKDPNNVRFYFDGTRILEAQTADFWEMEDEARIDVLMEQQGGGD